MNPLEQARTRPQREPEPLFDDSHYIPERPARRIGYTTIVLVVTALVWLLGKLLERN